MCLFASRVRKFAIIFAKQFSVRRIIEENPRSRVVGAMWSAARVKRSNTLTRQPATHNGL